MTASVIVWDGKDVPPDTGVPVLCWGSYAQGGGVISVPRYLEEQATRLRARYLAFIHDLGESRVDGQRIVDHLNLGEGFSLWWMTQLAEKSPFKSPRIYDCLRLLALEEILRARKPSELTLYSSDRELAQALRQLCENLRINFVRRAGDGRGRKWSLRRLYRGLPFPVQGLLSLRHFLRRWPLRRSRKPQWFSGDSAILLCSYFIHLDRDSCSQGRFYSRQWGALPQYLQDSGRRLNWIQHFLFSAAVPDLRTGLDWLGLFNRDSEKQGCHTFLDAYLTWGIVARALRDWLRLNSVARRLRQVHSAFYPQGSAAWLWPFLRRDWLTSLKGPVALSNCLWLALFEAVLQDAPRQAMGLYLCENQGWERAFLHAWRKHGHGEIIGVVHATVPFWHLYYFDDPRSVNSKEDCGMPLADRLAVNGQVAWKALTEAGFPVEKLAAVEGLRYLDLPAGEAARQARGKPLPSGATGAKILVLGDMLPDSMHNFLVLLEAAGQLLPPGYRFTFKPHPGYAVELAGYPGLRADETREALDRIVGDYDFAVAANSTSASVDAYVAGLPVIIALDGADLNLSPLRGQADVRFVRTPEELAEALQTKDRGRATNLERQEFFFLDPELPRWKQLLSSARPA